MESTLLQHLNSTGPAQLLIASIWQGLLLTACVWAGVKLAAAFGFSLRASARFTLWLIVFLLVALLPGFTFLRGMPLVHSFATPMAPVAGFSLHLNRAWAFAFEALWGFSSLLSLARLVSGGRQMRALFVSSTPVSPSELSEALRSIVTRPGTRPVEIRLSDAADAPSVIGFLRPAVVMPRSLWRDLGPAELEQIVLHELAHLDRGDDWTNLLQKSLRALSPLNPALFWAERHLCREREQACDDAVLAISGNARGYATCLTKLAESRLVRRAAALAPGLWKRPSELAARVDSILHRRRTLSPWWSRGVLAATLCATVTGAFTLQRFPRLVAFTGARPALAHSAGLDGDLATARLVPARFESRTTAGLPHAGYHDAVFHPAANRIAPLAPARHVSVAPKHHRRKTLVMYPARLRFVDVSSLPGKGDGFTLILFTVQVPDSDRGVHGALPLAEVPAFSLSNNWIAFQI